MFEPPALNWLTSPIPQPLMSASAAHSPATGILFFVKAPQPGRVKTRLAKAIGTQHATQLYQYFGLDLLQRLRSLPAELLICYAPAAEQGLIQAWLGPDQNYSPQAGEDLGARMAHAFQQAFARGYQRVIIIGSDSPDLPAAYLGEALNQLEQGKVVIGPAADGGYYTLGFTARNFLPEIFQGIAWSTPTVYLDSLKILRQHQRPIHTLPCWYDVDTLEDLEYFYQKNHPTAAPSQAIAYLTQYRKEIFVD